MVCTSSNKTRNREDVSADTSKKLGSTTVASTHRKTPIDTIGYLREQSNVIIICLISQSNMCPSPLSHCTLNIQIIFLFLLIILYMSH